MAATLVPTEGGSPIALDKPIILIGRHQECDISLQASSKVSRRHCCIVQVGDRYVLRDLGSMNGIRVNGHRIVETELCPGDELAVADICFLFRREDAAPRPPRAGESPRGAGARTSESARGAPVPQATPDDEAGDAANGYEAASPDEMPDFRIKDDSASEQPFVHV